MHIYHYAPYEPAALKRLMGRYSTREAEVDRMLRAELFVSRPEADVRAAPLDELVTLSSGRNRPIGTRYVRVSTRDGAHVALEP